MKKIISLVILILLVGCGIENVESDCYNDCCSANDCYFRLSNSKTFTTEEEFKLCQQNCFNFCYESKLGGENE